MHRQAIHRGRVNYEPNSLAGGCPFQAGAAQGFVSVPARIRADEEQGKVRAKPEKFADHYTQARLFYESQTPVEQCHIANAFRFELSKVTVPAIRQRMVASLRNASEELALKVAMGLGMELPPPLPLALPEPAQPEVLKSPPLSLLSRPGDGSLKGRKIAIVVAPGVVGAPLLKLQGGKAGVAPIFCVPGAGTSVTSFVDLMGEVERSWPLYGLQPRGMDGTTVPHSTVAAATEYYLRAVQEACPEGPIHLLGHSFGGWVAFEMALRLRAAGRPIGSLTLLDSEVPDDSEAVLREYGGGEAFLKLVEVLELTAERSLGIGPAEVASRDEAGWLKLLHGKMVGLGLLPARTTPEVLTGPFRTFARCVRTTYRPLGVYPGRLRLVLVDDPRMDEAANRANFAEVERGWREWAPGLVFSVGAGNHVTALKPPLVETLARFLAEDRGEG
jgi:thioesterase domain-containing protein